MGGKKQKWKVFFGGNTKDIAHKGIFLQERHYEEWQSLSVGFPQLHSPELLFRMLLAALGIEPRASHLQVFSHRLFEKLLVSKCIF
jgi:hypothetical protein